MEKTGQEIDSIQERIVSSIPSEDVLVRSSINYTPQYILDVFGRTKRNLKDVTLCKLLNSVREEFPTYKLVSIGTPVNFDVAPTHLTRVQMQFKNQEQVDACIKEISVSDLLIRSRIQPAWDWQSAISDRLNVILHVGWYDTVYFLKNKDIFLGNLHCRYSAKFNYDPNDAIITHYRYLDDGELEVLEDLTDFERQMDAVKDKIEFIRVFRDGARETT